MKIMENCKAWIAYFKRYRAKQIVECECECMQETHTEESCLLTHKCESEWEDKINFLFDTDAQSTLDFIDTNYVVVDTSITWHSFTIYSIAQLGLTFLI